VKQSVDTHPPQMHFIFIVLQKGFDLFENTRVIIMENYESTIIIQIFVYKIKYSINVIFHMLVLMGDKGRNIRHMKDQQIKRISATIRLGILYGESCKRPLPLMNI
jgi:hypothetical protein